MERRIRVLIFVVLVFLLAGDIFSSILYMMNLTSPNPKEKKKSTGKSTSKLKLDMSKEEFEDMDDQTLDLLAASTLTKSTLMATIRNTCLPKLICELNATPYRERLTESEKSLLGLIKDTSISTTAEVTSKYHFAAHMGQLIAGVEGTGCHNFYPGCPFPGLQVLQMMKRVNIR